LRFSRTALSRSVSDVLALQEGVAFPANAIAVDLGTANTLIYVKGEGIVLNEPSVVAIDRETKKIKGVGLEAKRMLGRTPDGIIAVRPMKDGVIADFDVTEKMLRYFLDAHHRQARLQGEAARDRVRAVGDHRGGEARRARLRARRRREGSVHGRRADGGGDRRRAAVETPTGQHGDRHRRRHHGDRGHRALGHRQRHVHPHRRRRARHEIVQFMRKNYNLLIGEPTAEQIKIQIGSAYPVGEEREMEVKGRDLVSGIPKTVRVHSSEIREAVQEPIQQIVDAVRRALEITPPELASRHRRSRHRDDRRRRAHSRARPAPQPGDRACRSTSTRTRSPASCAAPAGSSTTRRSTGRS
jgi:rod shape-determining protein MreB and related proteins